MMFQVAYYNFVTGLQILFAPAFGYQVYGFCGPAYKNDLIYGGCAQEGLYFSAGAFIGISGPCRKFMGGPENNRPVYPCVLWVSTIKPSLLIWFRFIAPWLF